jgi:4-amino-4-deoxy-L-arabinose transferase-like glycosyltransferase
MTSTKDRGRDPLAIVFVFCLLKIFIWLLTGANYGYFRDELYYLACADHLAWGYPDHAPLSIFLAWSSRAVFGDSLYAIHIFPTLAGVLKIILTGLIVREFDGRHLAMLLACLCVWIAPIYLGTDLLMSMNVYEPVFWMGCVLSYSWAVKRDDPRYWLMFGAFAGLGLMNKHSTVFFGIAFVLGLLFTRDRRVFAGKYIWLAAVVAFLLFLPNLIWQYQNNWATLELLRNVQSSGKNVSLSPLEFVWQQIFILLPLTAPIWLAGIWYFLFDNAGKRFRTLGIAYLVVIGLMIIFKAKNYYLAPVYPMLFGAGAVFWEYLLDRLRFGKMIAYVYITIIVISGFVCLPIAVPMLPVETFLRYQDAVGITPPKTEVSFDSPLPQHFADRFGWEEMTEATANVYNSLSSEERQRAAIYGDNYGDAGAIDFFGGKYGLPKAISGHQSYFMWGPRDYDGSVVIILGEQKEDAAKSCKSVEEREHVGHPYAMSYEHFNILICRGLKEPLNVIWPKVKHWN